MIKTLSTYLGRVLNGGTTSPEDKERYNIRLFRNEASDNRAIRRRAIRYLRKEFPTLGLSRIHTPVHSLAYNSMTVFRYEPKYAEMDRERAHRVVAMFQGLGMKAKAIDVKWALLE